MSFPMLDRRAELARLRRRFAKPAGGLSVVYGRRRLGKSRLVNEALGEHVTAHYVGDERDAALQRDAVAAEMARLVPRLDAVHYPSWDALLARWWAEAPRGAVLAFDEFPAVVATSPELPATLQVTGSTVQHARAMRISPSLTAWNNHGSCCTGSVSPAVSVSFGASVSVSSAWRHAVRASRSGAYTGRLRPGSSKVRTEAGSPRGLQLPPLAARPTVQNAPARPGGLAQAAANAATRSSANLRERARAQRRH